MKRDANPMQSAHDAPRCRARARSTGTRCRAPAVRGWRVCRMHGARGGHGTGKANPAYRHGTRTREWVAMRKAFNDLARMNAEVLAKIE